MKKRSHSLGPTEYIVFVNMVFLVIISLPVLIPIELWLRYKEKRELKKRMHGSR